ncbi:MAG: TfoX/Sxy family protein [Myxococcota bacterium]
MANTEAYEAALQRLPADEAAEIRRKTMFGQPCAFVNRQMFFGVFGDGWIARVGPARVERLVGEPGIRLFTPTEGQPWVDYVQLDAPIDADRLAGFAAEALAWTRALPPKVKGKLAKEKAAKAAGRG